MTRKEYLQNQTEAIMNGEILPILKKRIEDGDETINHKVGVIALLYGCGRMNPLKALMELSRLLTDEEFEKITKEVE